MASSSTKYIYIVWERRANDGSQSLADQPPKAVCFAHTPFEARKDCVLRARAYARSNSNSGLPNDLTPLWKGQNPKNTGLNMVYTFPGPRDTSIDVYNVSKTRPWFAESELVFDGHKYQVYFEPLSRTNCMNTTVKPLPALPIDARASPSKRITRGNETPHDQMMNAIEARAKRKLKLVISTPPDSSNVPNTSKTPKTPKTPKMLGAECPPTPPPMPSSSSGHSSASAIRRH